jgi:DNA repair exonuclease SbcCD ATPase subunit
MAKTTSDKPSVSAEEALKRRKKQARQEAKLMLEIEAANKDLKKAQKRQSKAQARLEERSTSLQTLEAKLAELRAPSLEPAIETPPDRAELERQQEPSEPESGIAHSDGNQQASPETGASTFTDEEQHAPVVEETTPSEAKVVTNEVTEGSEVAVVQANETATEPAPTPTTPRKAPAQKTVATRKPTVTKRPTSSSTATKRPANHSQSTRQPHADAE